MFRWLLILIALVAGPAAAQLPRQNAIQPELIVEGPAVPGGEVELAILMHTKLGWHGYWVNPGDAGLPMSIEWELPDGASWSGFDRALSGSAYFGQRAAQAVDEEAA